MPIPYFNVADIEVDGHDLLVPFVAPLPAEKLYLVCSVTGAQARGIQVEHVSNWVRSM